MSTNGRKAGGQAVQNTRKTLRERRAAAVAGGEDVKIPVIAQAKPDVDDDVDVVRADTRTYEEDTDATVPLAPIERPEAKAVSEELDRESQLDEPTSESPEQDFRPGLGRASSEPGIVGEARGPSGGREMPGGGLHKARGSFAGDRFGPKTSAPAKLPNPPAGPKRTLLRATSLPTAGGTSGEAVAQAEIREQAALELERRLKLSLRETTVSGIARVGVGSPKGGVGKSSIAYALAGSIAYFTNMRTCLVEADCDFGSTRLMVPRPVPASVVTLAEEAHTIEGLSDLRRYVAQNEALRLDVVLGPEQNHELARLSNLEEAYARMDAVLSRFYDVVVYDLGLGFRDPVIRRVLSFADELLFVTDSEIIPNAMLTDAMHYVERLGVNLSKTTLVMNHRLPPSDESAATGRVRTAHEEALRRVTEIPYDAAMSQLLNRRSFHVDDLSQATRLGVLTTVSACLEALREGKPKSKVGEGKVMENSTVL